MDHAKLPQKNTKKPSTPTKLDFLRCPSCGSTRTWKDGLRYNDHKQIQRYLCRACGYRFSKLNVKLNIVSQDRKLLHSCSNLTEKMVGDGNVGVEKSLDSFSLLVSKDVRSQDFKPSCITTVGKGLNTFLSDRTLCQVGVSNKEAKNLDSATEIKTVAGEVNQTTKGKLLQFALYMKLQGFSPVTIEGWNQKLERLSRNSNINDPESVKTYLAFHNMSEASKHYFCTAYNSFLKWQGKTWVAPKYKGTQKIPEFIPTEQELDALIAGCGPKTATVLLTLKETGMRIGECSRITWSSLNSEANTLTLNAPEKNSLPRIFKISPKLVGMLQRLPKKSDRIFPTSGRHMGIGFAAQRNKLARKLGNPRLAKIHFHLIRHWKGTMEYHKTQNIIHVQRLLGHKSVLNTQLYVNLEEAIFEFNDQYEVKLASTVEEAVKLVEVGFEYITEMDGKKLFRKRK